MSRTSLFSLLLILIGCSPPASNDEGVSASSNPVLDSLPGDVVSPGIDPISVDEKRLKPDTSLYIGEIWTFPETGELYTPLYYHEGIDVDKVYQWLPKQTDSTIYEDVEVRRRRLPVTIAKKYLNLSGLDTISVFEKGKFACTARLVRVEYFDDIIESQSIAVFKPIGSLPEEPDYCISSGRNPFESVAISYETFEDEQLTKQLLATYGRDASQLWHASHTRILPYDAVYSAISFDSRLLLVETQNGQSRVLLDEGQNTSIFELIPTHLQSNGKPILLLKMVVNETDIMWTALAIYSGKEYITVDGNRIGDQ